MSRSEDAEDEREKGGARSREDHWQPPQSPNTMDRSCCKCGQGDAGEVLEVICHIGVAGEVNVEEAERGENEQPVRSPSSKRQATQPSPRRHEHSEEANDSCQRKPCCQPVQWHVPTLVDERELGGPQKLRGIEPEGLGTDREPVRQVAFVDSPCGAHARSLQPRGDSTGSSAEGEQRTHGHHVLSRHCPTPGIDEYQQHGGKWSDGRLGGERKRKHDERTSPELPTTGLIDGSIKGNERERGSQGERQGQDILSLSDPCHRVHVDRVQSKHNRGQSCAGESQLHQEPSQKD